MPVAVRRGFCRELEATIGLLARQYNDLPRDLARREAMAAVATMLGSILLARSANDPHLSDGMLAAGRRVILDATADGVRNVGAARSARTNRRRRAAQK
jgi:TetR/AcrR family transcriptional repressor of nem operon